MDSRARSVPFFVALSILVLAFTGSISAKQNDVAAKVGQWEIKGSRVDRYLEVTIGKRDLGPELLKRARVEACEHLVRRQVVYEHIKKFCPVPESEIRSELSILETNLAKVDKTIDDHLKKTRMSQEELENEIVWKTAWAAYIQKKINKQSMAKYFGTNRRLYDGTEVRVAQIVFEKSNDVAKQVESAKKVRASIGAGEISWEDAVKANSIATESKKSAGEIGWVRHSEPMPVVFGKVAVLLDLDQISEPVVTSFGVHLIKCLERKKGKIELADVEEQLRSDMTRFLFDRIADKHRGEVEVIYGEGFQRSKETHNGT